MTSELDAVRTRQTVLSMTRTFTEAEQVRRTAIADAARELAAERGYEATTIRDIAATAGTTPATVYRYFGSKDQLLHHIMVEWALATTGRLWERSYRGEPADRIGAAFADVIRWAAAEPALLAAGMSSFHSPATGDGMATWQTLFIALVRAALGDETWKDTAGQALTLGHVLVACMLDLTSGRNDPERIAGHIDLAAHLIFRP